MSRNQIVWTVVGLIVTVLFYSCIPVATYENHTVFTSFFGALLLGFCLFMMMGNFNSLDEIRTITSENASGLRRYSFLAIFPAFLFLIVLIIHQGARKKEEIIKHGAFAKGTVLDGGATTTTRRFKSSTSYSLTIEYKDSSDVRHILKESVDGSDFYEMYQGATVDVQYSKRYPSLARIVTSRDELAKHMAIPTDTLTIRHLISILESEVHPDSVLSYLNSINYEWVEAEKKFYYNSKLDLGVKVFPGTKEIAFVEQSSIFSASPQSIESTFVVNGFKKKSTTSNGETIESYYNDQYVISKERDTSKGRNTDQPLMSKILTIYRVAAIQ